MNLRSISAELIGSFSYVAALFAAILFAEPAGGGLVATALAPGLAFIAMSYAVGHVSGGHFNPAVTLGLVAGGALRAGRSYGIHRCATAWRHRSRSVHLRHSSWRDHRRLADVVRNRQHLRE